MAYSGYLIKVGSSEVEIPITYIKPESYTSAPDQPLDLDSTRAIDGVLHRTVLEHTATKIEFETPSLTDAQLTALWTIISDAFITTKERNLTVNYYDMLTGDYDTGEFYVPTVKPTINIIKPDNTIIYNPVRIAFIEY